MEFQFQLSPKKVVDKNAAKTTSQKKQKKNSQVSFENYKPDINTQVSAKKVPTSLPRSRTSMSPQNEKFKKHFSMKITRLIEENFNLKKRN